MKILFWLLSFYTHMCKNMSIIHGYENKIKCTQMRIIQLIFKHLPTGIPRKSLSGKYHPSTIVTSLVSPGFRVTCPDTAPETWWPLALLENLPSSENSVHNFVTSSLKPMDLESCTRKWNNKLLTTAYSTFNNKIESCDLQVSCALYRIHITKDLHCHLRSRHRETYFHW